MPTPPLSDELAQEAVDTLERYGKKYLAAKALGLHINTFQNRLDVAARRGLSSTRARREAVQGWSPEHDMVHTVPAPFIVRGVSQYYDKDGKAAGVWVKSKLDDAQYEQAVKAAVEILSQSVAGMSPLQDKPEYSYSDILAVYPLGDPHIGLYAWSKESGDDFDIEIAKRQTLAAVDRLLASAPSSEVCLIIPLGDVFHADDQSNTTPAHHNQLDVDSRYVKVIGLGIEMFRHMILRALQKHDKVVVRFQPGNHDPHSIWALAFTIRAFFANEPRVEVDLSPSLFWFYRFGKVLLGVTHGDKVKHDGLLGVMAADRSVDWGETKHRYFYTGHVHSQHVREYPGLICESFRTLAAKDAYAAGNGYRAGRDMVCIVHHKDHGEIERHRCDIGMVN